MCAALAIFVMAGVSCASDQTNPATIPATAVLPSPTSAPLVAPTPTAQPVATRAPVAATGKAAAIVPQSNIAQPTLEPVDRAAAPDRAMTAGDFPTPPARDLLQLARQLRWDGVEPAPGPERFAGRTLAVGDTTEFWTLDYPKREMVRKEFRLAAVSEHAYWWVEQGVRVNEEDLQRTVDDAERQVYPRVTAVFGEPGELAGDDKRGHIINVGSRASGATFRAQTPIRLSCSPSATRCRPSTSTPTPCPWAATNTWTFWPTNYSTPFIGSPIRRKIPG